MRRIESNKAWLVTMFHVVVPVILTVVLFVVSIFFILLPHIEHNLMDARRRMIQELTATAWELIGDYYKRSVNGELSVQDAQHRASERVRALRYGLDGKDYFWINDLDHIMVMHPYRPELEGQDLWNYADPDGNYLFRNFVNVVQKSGAGFVDYKWQWKDDPLRIVSKESYVRLFEPWGWIIGTGVYLEDVHAEIVIITRKLLWTMVGILILVSLLSAFSIWDGRKRECARVAAGHALRLSEERFRQLANASWEAIVIHDNGVLLHANEQFFEMVGYAPDELIGQPIVDKIFAQQSRAKARERIHHDQFGPCEMMGLRKDTSTFPIEMRARLLEYQGRKVNVTALRDISERKQMEDIMIQSEKMMSVGGLAAGMAHEINNPLAGMVQNLQVLQQRLLQPLPGNIAAAEKCNLTMEMLGAYMHERHIPEMITSALESGKRAAAIVRDMLSFSRKSESNYAKFNIRELVDKAIALAFNEYDLKTRYDFRKIKIVRNYTPELPFVECSGSKLQQVFLNVLKNGAQAMMMNEPSEDMKPTFIISICRVNDHVQISFCDNGPGMTEETRRRIFEPFYTTKDVGIGTGLGLSVSYFIITKIHDGHMVAESEPGKGTTIIITIPFDHHEAVA